MVSYFTVRFTNSCPRHFPVSYSFDLLTVLSALLTLSRIFYHGIESATVEVNLTFYFSTFFVISIQIFIVPKYSNSNLNCYCFSASELAAARLRRGDGSYRLSLTIALRKMRAYEEKEKRKNFSAISNWEFNDDFSVMCQFVQLAFARNRKIDNKKGSR